MVSSLRSETGQSLVELSLALPIMVFVLIGGADMARAYALQVAVENGARAGAESFAIDSTATTSEAQAAVVAEINRTPTANATAANVTVLKAQVDGTTACLTPPTVATPCFVSVRVQYPWSTLVAWPFIPTSGTFDRTTTYRTFY